MSRKKVYFVSDFHLGLDIPHQSSEDRETLIVKWLDQIKEDAGELYLLGDVFDYWFEFRTGTPTGFEKFLEKIGELKAAGLPIYFFTGNHDLWMKSYLKDQFGIPIYRKPITKKIQNKIFHLAHGDGLGPGDLKYKMMKKVFTNPMCQAAFGLVPRDVGFGMMKYFSKRSREKYSEPIEFLGKDKEALLIYANEYEQEREVDYFIFGHRHLPIDHTLDNKISRYINLGEWLNFRSYGVLDDGELQLKFFENPDGKVFG